MLQAAGNETKQSLPRSRRSRRCRRRHRRHRQRLHNQMGPAAAARV